MLWIICGTLLVVLVLYLSVSFVAFRFFVDRSFSKDILFKGKNAEAAKNPNTDSIQYTEVFIDSFDKLNLHAFLLKADSHKWIVCVHGYSGNASNMLLYANKFLAKGFNVLAIDLRAHGKSDGKYFGLSYLDAKDISLWCKWIEEQDSNAKIVLMGISLGGASVLMAAAKDDNTLLRCVISDSAPSDFLKQFSRMWKRYLKIPPNYFLPMINTWMRLVAKYSIHDASPITYIKSISVPCLIIHGENDGFVNSKMALEIYGELASDKKLLIVPGANHTQSIKVQPDLYWNTIQNFLSKYNLWD